MPEYRADGIVRASWMDTGGVPTVRVNGIGTFSPEQALAFAECVAKCAQEARASAPLEASLFDQPLDFPIARSADLPATSHEAADSMQPVIERVRRQILAHLSQTPDGATDDELEAALGLKHQTASATRRGLVIAGLVWDTGKTRKTRSGRNAIVWALDKPSKENT